MPEELAKQDVVRVRALEALREIGELFIAFGFLDGLLSDALKFAVVGLVFVVVGAILLSYAVIIEWRAAP